MTTLRPRARKLLLNLHVAVSVGWLGAVAAFLGLAIAVLASDDAPLARGAYLAMEVTGWWVLVLLSVGCLLTGVVQSLGTDCGLVRHYWVLSTMLINVVATAVLLMFMGTLGALADQVRTPGLSDADVLELRNPAPVVHAALALLVLLLATWLSVAKPRGLTRYGQRCRRAARAAVGGAA